MRSSRAQALIALFAVLLNVLGSPMAWADWLGADGGEPVPAAADMAAGPCHGHELPAGDPGAMPCCEGGDCQCAVPAVFIYVTATAARIPHPPFIAPVDTSALPPHPLDDTLRPPIR